MEEILPSTQSRLHLQEIKDGFLILKDGRFLMAVQTSAVNFDLLSEAEQDAMIAAYAEVLNSLPFPIEIVIHTRRMDISNYLLYLETYEKKQTNKALHDQITYYRNFVKQLVVENNVLFKKFYLVLPYDVAEKNKLNFMDRVVGQVTGGNRKVSAYSQAEFEAAKQHLTEKFEELKNLFSRMNIKLRQLNNQEILELFYEIYNPRQAAKQHLNETIEDYTVPIVQPAME
jgi:hypothetical protein